MATCKAAYLGCIDSRVQEAVKIITGHSGLSLGDYDYITDAGAAKSFLDSPEGRIGELIHFAVEQHKIETLIIAHHTDCGGYGGCSVHDSVGDEINFHRRELVRARNVLAELYPDLEVVLVIINISDTDRPYIIYVD